ncbi:hypothetical protein BGZ76_009926 [Entomortierella beljakovae]|nr:hypothetical protein BGZ76_009926 [Entomortierella beljakovae]
MSGLASNDVVILTMTPFLVYFANAVSLESSVAFLMAEVQTANIASMALYIGNLTNVVACQAFNITFLEYSAWMLIPTFAAIAACYIMLRINFRKEKYIPTILKSPDVDPRSCLADPVGAVFGLCILSCSLICLIGTSFAHVSVWLVTGPFALLSFFRDFWFDWNGKFKGVKTVSLVVPSQDMVNGDDKDVPASYVLTTIESRIEQGLPEIAIPEISIVQPVQILGSSSHGYDDSAQASTISCASSINENEGSRDIKPMYSRDDEGVSKRTSAHASPSQMPLEGAETMTVSIPNENAMSTEDPKPRRLKKHKAKFEGRFPLLYSIVIRMPWSILPFTFSMFILVEGLSHSGWISIFANWATKVIPNYIAATYAIGFISVLLCNIFNNVPMTILMVRVLQHPNFIASPLATPEVQKAALFALVVGSNLGACTTLISSLAGLMWDSVLRSKNSSVGFWQFLRWNIGVMPMVIFVALSVVVIELNEANCIPTHSSTKAIPGNKSGQASTTQNLQALTPIPSHFIYSYSRTPTFSHLARITNNSKIMSSQGITRIQKSSPFVPISSAMKSRTKTVQLRNIANTVVSRRSASDPITRTDILDALMPLSRNPWNSESTLIEGPGSIKSAHSY